MAYKLSTQWFPYVPTYDPLVTSVPGHGQNYAPTYWVADAGDTIQDDGPIETDISVDVAIIGSGFTGLATAIFLAQQHGIRAHVLEANSVSWGCTSRNGGQAQNASGRLKRSQWIKLWGRETALALHQEIEDGFETFKELMNDIDCDAVPGGHLYVAHQAKVMSILAAEIKLMRDVFGYKCRLISEQELKSDYLNEVEAHGALWEPEGIGVHPVKLAHGYIRKARAAGVKIHPASPVVEWETRNGRHFLRTPGGVVSASSVGVATGGYTGQKLHRSLRNKIMPVLSNNMVTRPLSGSEIEACNFKTRLIITDTRILRHYYRLLPDNRVQIGSRSAITGADAPNPKHQDRLVSHMVRKFPALEGIDIDYYWWGWVDVSHDMMPRIYQPDQNEQAFYAMGYGGNGVMYSAQAGKRMAERIAGKPVPDHLPFFDSPLPSEIFAPFRRIGQRFLYQWYHLKDEVL